MANNKHQGRGILVPYSFTLNIQNLHTFYLMKAFLNPIPNNNKTPRQVCGMSQAVRDHVGALLLRLTLKELFDWHFMQVV